jgi:hypothetical protein
MANSNRRYQNFDLDELLPVAWPEGVQWGICTPKA